MHLRARAFARRWGELQCSAGAHLHAQLQQRQEAGHNVASVLASVQMLQQPCHKGLPVHPPLPAQMPGITSAGQSARHQIFAAFPRLVQPHL